MQFTRLRFQGFKSFVDPTELLIELGLTGIVGPNGCGKSNLVEALQWVMGEGSARRLRGGDMDDVIFAGTTTRPGKAAASACLDVTGAAQRFDETTDELEIERRIVRGKGSTYRVNGREQRARDVQTLFADAASGAQSVSLIGQGRIGWLINAKPTERRSLLEEAAGIAGLQGRRREAETKLAAAEANLVRLEDAQAGLVAQIERLKKQARTAERYKKLSEAVTQYEAALLHRLWLDQVTRLEQARTELADASARASEAATSAASAAAAKIDAAAELPPLRDTVSAADAAVAEGSAALLALDGERQRVVQQLADARQRLIQIRTDSDRETALAEDAARAFARLEAEAGGLSIELDQDGVVVAEIAALIAAAKPAVAAGEDAVAAETGKLAADKAALTAAESALATLAYRLKQLTANAEQAVAQVRQLESQQISPAALSAAESQIAAAEAELNAASPAVEQAAQAVADADAARQAARQQSNDTERTLLTIQAEINALTRVLAETGGEAFPPVLDRIEVERGLETALGAALGDDLLASSNAAAPRCWRMIDAAAAMELPAGAEPFIRYVKAPDALARRLAAIGLVPDEATGRRLQASLQPGQRLVARDGSLWRWDGLAVSATAISAAAIRLEQRNRLNQATVSSVEAAAVLDAARTIEQASVTRYEASRQTEKLARIAHIEVTQRIAEFRRAHLAMSQAHSAGAAKLGAAIELRDRLRSEARLLTSERANAEQARLALPDRSAAEARLLELRDTLRHARETLANHQRRADFVERDITSRRRRLTAIAAEMSAWQERKAGAAAQRAAQENRRAILEAEIATLADRPERLARDHETASAALASTRDLAAQALGRLRSGEARIAEAERSHAMALQAHGAAREKLVRAESLVEHTEQLTETAARQIRDRFDCAAAALPERVSFGTAASAQKTEEIELRLGTARRDRDALGPVNLMAESELATLAGELELIRTESADLTAAIAKLRQAIAQINQEGRDRLQIAFNAVNQHFQTLFIRLFGGGSAHLELSFADGDPLAAGLEIMASPPGKKLQMLSLLSGGERALTALALIFAAFLANPAPICVLDEVDAPLDDANVERFCILVREIADRAATRFLIVTHHRVTMARMDRLYGVTMMERGVSRLVSVELQAAQQLRRTA